MGGRDLNIIKAKIEDLIDISNLIECCRKHMESQGIYQWDELYPSLDIIKNDIVSQNSYIVKNGEKSIAYVSIQNDEPEEYNKIQWQYNTKNVLTIHRLCVEPEFQGEGIAKCILKFIEDYAFENYYDCIRLDAYSGNKRALKLYENFGYKHRGQVIFPRRKYPFNCYEKQIINISDNLSIDKLTYDYKDEVIKVFEVTMQSAFEEQGVGHLTEIIVEEIEAKK